MDTDFGQPASMFGQVKIFNERTSAANVRVQLCTVSNGAVSSIASSGQVPLQGAAVGATLYPANTLNPKPGTSNVTRILVDVFDGSGNLVTTFGPWGVGLVGGASVNNVVVTLTNTSDVMVQLVKHNGAVIRTVSQAAIAPCSATIQSVANSDYVQLVGTPIVQGNAIIESATSLSWQVIASTLGSSPTVASMQYQLTAATGGLSTALGCASNGSGGFDAAQTNVSPTVQSPSNVLLLIRYSDGGTSNWYRIVDSASGLALTVPQATLPNPQLQFQSPDSPTITTAQFWVFSPALTTS